MNYAEMSEYFPEDLFVATNSSSLENSYNNGGKLDLTTPLLDESNLSGEDEPISFTSPSPVEASSRRDLSGLNLVIYHAK